MVLGKTIAGSSVSITLFSFLQKSLLQANLVLEKYLLLPKLHYHHYYYHFSMWVVWVWCVVISKQLLTGTYRYTLQNRGIMTCDKW